MGSQISGGVDGHAAWNLRDKCTKARGAVQAGIKPGPLI